MLKHIDIARALAWNGITEVDHKKNLAEGLEQLQKKPYDLLVLDMHFPLEVGSEADPEAGMKALMALKELEIDIPIIICSSDRLRIDEVLGCVFYNPSRDLNFDFKELLEKIR
jgi:CheY-like chemotaxis protein